MQDHKISTTVPEIPIPFTPASVSIPPVEDIPVLWEKTFQGINVLALFLAKDYLLLPAATKRLIVHQAVVSVGFLDHIIRSIEKAEEAERRMNQ